MQITPNAIPNAQKAAIAESSLTSCRFESHSTPKAEAIENNSAEKIGEIPK
jgi:hypothetical protein